MKCLYIYNPVSGKGISKKVREYIVSALKTKYDAVDVKRTQKRGDARDFANAACGYYDTIVVSGGDGTMNEVISGIANQENRPTLGYVPTGTVNDLAHSLKISSNYKKAVKTILNGITISHDIFKANEKYGIYVCGFGIFTGTSYKSTQKSKKIMGKLAYYITGAKDLGKVNKFPITLKYDNTEISTDVILGLIVNNKYVGGYKINNKADCTDGNVNIILFKEKKKKGISLKAFFNVIKTFLFGIKTLKSSNDCIILELNKFRMELNDKRINIDGEYAFNGSFDFEVLPRHINIFVNSNYKTEYK